MQRLFTRVNLIRLIFIIPKPKKANTCTLNCYLFVAPKQVILVCKLKCISFVFKLVVKKEPGIITFLSLAN